MASMASARASTEEAGEATSPDDDEDAQTNSQWTTTEEEVGAAEISILPLGYTDPKRSADDPTRQADTDVAESPKRRKYVKKVKALSSYPCGRCNKEVVDGEEAILCEQKCFKWFHRPCAGASPFGLRPCVCPNHVCANKCGRSSSSAWFSIR